jgi:beta-lactamase regulating signal transducer with metallopeptidase domain
VPEYLGYLLVDYSFLVLSVAQRFILFSAAGLLLVLLIARTFRLHPHRMAFIWLLYLVWLIPASAPLMPSLPQGWLAHMGLQDFSLSDPCAALPIERLGNTILPFAPFFNTKVTLFLLWFAIASFLLLRLALKRWEFVRLIHRACTLTTTDLQSLLLTQRAAYGLTRNVRLVSSDEYPAPFTIGFWRPVIFLPQTMLNQLDRSTLMVVLAHELAHIKRRDDLYILLQHIFGAIFFFNPLIRYADRQLSESREMCCDHMAVNQCRIPPRDYGHALLRVVEYFRQPALVAAPVAGFLSRDIHVRIRSLVQLPGKRKSWLPIALTLLGLTGVSTVFGGINQTPAHITEMQQARAALVHLQPVSPLPDGVLISGVDILRPMGCFMPHRDQYHSGIDLQPLGGSAPVVAFADGRVISVTTLPAYVGKLVRIKHAGGFVSAYARLDEVWVRKGDQIRAGQPFASVGATPRTDHLHFEVTRDQAVVDPTFLLR